MKKILLLFSLAASSSGLVLTGVNLIQNTYGSKNYTSCVQLDLAHKGNNIDKRLQKTSSIEECWQKCMETPTCSLWNYVDRSSPFSSYAGYCYLKNKSSKNPTRLKGYIAGAKGCDPTATNEELSKNSVDYNPSSSQEEPVFRKVPDFTKSLRKCHTARKPFIPPEQRKAMENLNVRAVKRDIKRLLTDSQGYWPADYGNYGPLFIRLAWHSAGTYRLSDGRGGGDGARQRFEPEQSWEDNANLDKARHLLTNIKTKYGPGLSWGDLLILSGNVAIESMGGPVLGFCGGRIDDFDGSESALLGPTPEQEEQYPCEEWGNCRRPHGTAQLELIYVNPEGPRGTPDPAKSAENIRDIFGRMGMNDSETVALIGGGHAFGKVHGACPQGAGPTPKEDPHNPWPGFCGTGRGPDTYTSGFEFPFTSQPTRWDNEYFQNLVAFDYEKSKGPGDKWEWKSTGTRLQADTVDGKGKQEVGMLTSDIALKKDAKYLKLVHKWARDEASFDHDFKHAWYKLTTRDMGPRSRCLGKDVPPAQPFQYPLPKPSNKLLNVNSVKSAIRRLLQAEEDDLVGSLIRLSWQCSATYRATDYLGGCNGARIRFSPQKDWPVNAGLDTAVGKLAEIKSEYEDDVSWADLIILAGYVAVEMAGGLPMPFCQGRTDASGDDGMSHALDKDISSVFQNFNELCSFIDLMDLTNEEYSVLHAAGYSIGEVSGPGGARGLFGRRDGTQTDGKLSNVFFRRIVGMEDRRGMTKLDLMFKQNKDLWRIAHIYAQNNKLFLQHFSAAWTKVSNFGSFDGPFGNLCDKGRFQ